MIWKDAYVILLDLKIDSEHVKHSIREYVKRKDKDLFKLSKYAEKLGIKKEVMDYVEVFYE